ncbi:MAG: hypothetical protein L6301_00865 [Desulfobacteraceae bacterium]|nr:hypothetical protein [Desulfobacteraceae bacterium]
MAAHLKIDWEAIEADFRAGIKTLRAMASEHGISHGAINKRAKRDSWDRDLSVKIKSKAAALVSKKSVSKPVSKVSKTTERTIIEENAELIAGVILSHRKDIPLKRELVSKLFAEVEAMTDNSDMMEQLLEALEKEDNTLLASCARKIISLPQRIKGVADLVTAYKSLIGLEREAFGLNDPGVTDPNAPDAISVTFRRASHERD